MAEKVVSPGVFTNEIDQSFLPAAVGEIGAAVVGPTVKGPALIPTVVSSYSEYQQIFGDTFKSGSNYYSYLTSVAAQNYLRHGNKLTVVRILDNPTTVSEASSSVASGVSSVAGTFASGTVTITGGQVILNQEITIGGVDFIFVGDSTNFDNNASELYITSGALATSAGNLRDVINNNVATHGLGISASAAAGVVTISGSVAGTAANLTAASSSAAFTFSGDKTKAVEGGTGGTAGVAFKLHTLGDGVIMNSKSTEGTNNVLPSGSKDNLRWEVTQQSPKKGTFTLTIRRGDDTSKRKQVLETWNNVSLDPMTPNYIEKVIGSQYNTLQGSGGTAYIQPVGDYPVKSKYVRVASVDQTPDYLNENGELTDNAQSQSLPVVGSGSFEGGANGLGAASGPDTFYEAITSAAKDNVQGFDLDTANRGKTAYNDALTLLSNADEYDINMILLPGVSNDIGSAIVDKAITTCEDRGDCFVLADPVAYGSTKTLAIAEAEKYDSNYAAMYWPWVQMPDAQLGRNVWVPPSVALAGVFAFNDKVAHPWFAPAGLNRGGIDNAIQAERKLAHADRDDMYESNLNPIATFPAQGVCVWGQKTLQKKSSALDRVNVRRLMIKVKKFIASSSRFLVFEQNNSATRRRFLNIVNPYLETVQSNSGLNAFKVVMDDTNNTPDVVDRNILFGQIFLQPTKTAEFIVLDFTIQPTGATFPE